MNIMSVGFFYADYVLAMNIYEIAVVTFLLKMSSKKKRLSRKITRERSSNRKRMRWRTSAHVSPRLFSICSSSCIDFTWPSTCSRHVRLPFRTHLAIVASYSYVNTHGCTFLKEVHGEMHCSLDRAVIFAALRLKEEKFFNKIYQKEYEKQIVSRIWKYILIFLV